MVYILKDTRKRKAFIDDMLEASYNSQRQAEERNKKLDELLNPSKFKIQNSKREETIKKVDLRNVRLPEKPKEEIELTFSKLKEDPVIFWGTKIITDEKGNVLKVEQTRLKK
jgi:hypothetical protein